MEVGKKSGFFSTYAIDTTYPHRLILSHFLLNFYIHYLHNLHKPMQYNSLPQPHAWGQVEENHTQNTRSRATLHFHHNGVYTVRPILKRKRVTAAQLRALGLLPPPHKPGRFLQKRRAWQEEEKIRRQLEASQKKASARHGRAVEALYDMQPGDYMRMLERQNRACVACNRPESELDRRLCVDHCHVTGKVRGLLCAPCNTALGLVRENPRTLRHLAIYLEFHTAIEEKR